MASQRLTTFETALNYQLHHAIVLVLVGGLIRLLGDWPALVTLLGWAGNSFLMGTLIFSGSLYALCLTDNPWWGVTTPFGALAFLAGWTLLAWALFCWIFR